MTSSAKATDLTQPRREGARQVYDRRALSYSSSFEHSVPCAIVRGIEWLTAKPKILAMVRKFERNGPHEAERFFADVLDTLGATVTTPAAQIARIPSKGPVIFVANHPHGLVDGMVIETMVARRRHDYRVLARALLTGLDTVASDHLVAVPFPHKPDAQRQMVEMRRRAMAYLAPGGLVALLPVGGVAASQSLFGPAVEGGVERLYRQDDPPVRRDGRAMLFPRQQLACPPHCKPYLADSAAGVAFA